MRMVVTRRLVSTHACFGRGATHSLPDRARSHSLSPGAGQGTTQTWLSLALLIVGHVVEHKPLLELMDLTIISIVSAASARRAGPPAVAVHHVPTFSCRPRRPDCGACCCQRDRCQHQARCVPHPQAARLLRCLPQRAPAHPARPEVKCLMSMYVLA